MDNEGKLTVFNILRNVGLYSIRKRCLKSSRMRGAIHHLPKTITKIRNPPLPTFENVEDSDNLECQGVKIIFPSDIVNIYTRLEILLRLKLSGHTDTLAEAKNLIGNSDNRSEIQSEQHYRNAPNKFHTL